MEMGIILGENLKKILIIPATAGVEKFLFFPDKLFLSCQNKKFELSLWGKEVTV